MFDITAFTPADTSFLHLKSPVDEEPLFVTPREAAEGAAAPAKLPVGITFHAPGSDAYETAVKRRSDRALMRSKRNITLNSDMVRADQVDFLAGVTASFDQLGYPPAAGATGEDLFKALYADRKFGWVVDQANAHLADWANFTKASATS